MFILVAQLVSWLDVVFDMLDVPISAPRTIIPFFWTLTRESLVSPLRAAGHPCRVACADSFRAYDRCRAI